VTAQPVGSFLVVAFLLLAAGEAFARPAVIYSVGGKFDGSFNEAAFAGAERYREETGENYGEFEIASPAQSLQALKTFAQKGFSPIVAIGFNHASALAEVAPQFPETQFAIVDAAVDAPNVQSILFREQEGSYVVGVLAAMASKSKVIGFVGGMDIPIIRKFACGYVLGARSVDRKVKVLVNMTGPGPIRHAAPSWRARRSNAAPTSSSRRPAAPASAYCRRLPTPRCWASARIRTRTACTPAGC